MALSTCHNGYTNHPPSSIILPSGKTAVSLSDANQGHFCAILDTGEGLCWGWNNHGELGDGTVCTGGSWQSADSVTPLLQDAMQTTAGISLR